MKSYVWNKNIPEGSMEKKLYYREMSNFVLCYLDVVKTRGIREAWSQEEIGRPLYSDTIVILSRKELDIAHQWIISILIQSNLLLNEQSNMFNSESF